MAITDMCVLNCMYYTKTVYGFTDSRGPMQFFFLCSHSIQALHSTFSALYIHAWLTFHLSQPIHTLLSDLEVNSSFPSTVTSDLNFSTSYNSPYSNQLYLKLVSYSCTFFFFLLYIQILGLSNCTYSHTVQKLSFTFQCSLQRHQHIHTGEKSYKCPR